MGDQMGAPATLASFASVKELSCGTVLELITTYRSQCWVQREGVERLTASLLRQCKSWKCDGGRDETKVGEHSLDLMTDSQA